MIPQERLELLDLASDLVKQAENLQEQANELLDLASDLMKQEVGTLLNKMEKDRGKD